MQLLVEAQGGTIVTGRHPQTAAEIAVSDTNARMRCPTRFGYRTSLDRVRGKGFQQRPAQALRSTETELIEPRQPHSFPVLGARRER